MIYLNTSNSLEKLADNFCAELRNERLGVFQPQFIVTQTLGMNNWLKLQIASHNGIAANCVFVSPNEIIQKIYYFLGGKHPNLLSPQNLSWILYAILGEPEFIQRFPHVAAYYNHDGHDKDLKRMALAEKTADLFDQYQIYRPEWIESWNTGKPVNLDDENWQLHLWSRAKALSLERLPDKTVLGKFIRESLKDPLKKEELKLKVPFLHLFGLSIITDYHLELLYEIAKSIDVHFHLANPAPSIYWFEDRSEKQLAFLIKKGFRDRSETAQGNALLTSWGRVIQDTFMMLFRNEELLNNLQETAVEEPQTDSLLHKIQHDIYHAAGREDRNAIDHSDLEDGSIQISSCYTIAREVEVLYNYLVHLVDQKKEKISPRDIVVMVTDIDGYAPYIKAVFKNAPFKFYFTIADESLTTGDSLTGALSSLLKINRLNFKAEEVLQLLDSGFIRGRFTINDLDLIRRIVQAANIRFGIEGNAQDDTRFVSWEYGIKRIVYGLCMSDGSSYTDPSNESLYPLDIIEGGDSQTAIRFCHFVTVLIDSIRERERSRTIGEWVEYIERVIQNLVCEPDEDLDEDYSQLQLQLAAMNTADEFMKEKIPFEIFTTALLQTLMRTERSGAFAGGGITFCSLIPMRSIPFKVVALLGMNFDKFPRKENPPSFNLISSDQRRRGDRNIKENDKHLFLDTILSARNYLYISYLGQSTKDNSSQPPSALVDELIDYIEAKSEQPALVKKSLTTRHPLHGFGHHEKSTTFSNYLEAKRKTAITIADNNKEREPVHFDEISLDSLVAFFKNPVKTYYNKILKIYYSEEDVLLSDTEIFELNKLQEWELKTKLVTLRADEIPALQERMLKTGGLPLKNMAGIVIDTVDAEVDSARKMLTKCIGTQNEQTHPIEIVIDKSILCGPVKLYGNKLVQISYSKHENKYLIELYIQYLAAIASGIDCQVYFISANHESIYEGRPVSQTAARQGLGELVKIYKEGHQTMLAFIAELDISANAIATRDYQKFSKSVHKAFERNTNRDRYLLNEYENGSLDSETGFSQFTNIFEKLMIPLSQVFPGYFENSKKNK